MDGAAARARAEEWIAAWNARDLERILSHYTEDFTMSSPFISTVVRESSGTLRGKAAVRAYWKRGFELVPSMRFELLEVLVGIDSLAICYRSTLTAGTVVEVLTLEGELYASGHAHYAV